jgi:hypothetical protein
MALLLPPSSTSLPKSESGPRHRRCRGSLQGAKDIMRLRRLLDVPLVLAAALAAAGCGSVPGANPAMIGSLPPDAPAAPAEQRPFPHVYDIPPARPAKLITEEEQARLEAELTALRRRVNSRADALEKDP